MSEPSRPTASAERGANVMMVRPTLDDIPEHPLPEGFCLRPYHAGDEAAWTRIWMTADMYSTVTPETFQKEFGDHAEALPERQVFLCDVDGREVGTATAWFCPADLDPEAGLVHWVAIAPQHQGRHLAKPLVSAVLTHLAELEHSRAVLITQEGRLAAINLYLEMGFVPRIRSDDERAAWHRVREQLRGSRLDALDLDA
jgi:GNAT superfamily N-acetyltransferase